MRPTTKIVALSAVALFLGVLATDARGQMAGEAAKQTIVTPAWLYLDGLPPDVVTHIEKGDQLIADRKYGPARREYRAAAELIEAAGGIPLVPLRRIAEAYYFEGMYQSAVHTLDGLAQDAGRRGDPVTQIWALADAAWVLGEDYKRKPRGGAKLEIESRVAQLHTLLAGPYLPEAVRQEVMAKRLDGCCLALDDQAKTRSHARRIAGTVIPPR